MALAAKKLQGATFSRPLASRLVTGATGRGTTAPVRLEALDGRHALEAEPHGGRPVR